MKREEKSTCPSKKPPLRNEHLYAQVQRKRKKPRSETRRAQGAGELQAASRSWVWEQGSCTGQTQPAASHAPCVPALRQSQFQHVHYTDLFVKQEQMCSNQDLGLCCSFQAVGAFLNTQDLKSRKNVQQSKVSNSIKHTWLLFLLLAFSIYFETCTEHFSACCCARFVCLSLVGCVQEKRTPLYVCLLSFLITRDQVASRQFVLFGALY